MNKLISSTFLHCPRLPSCFSNKWKRKRANVEKTFPYLRERSSVIRRYVSFATLIKSPALPLCPVGIFATRV